MKRNRTPGGICGSKRARGFTLVEVMVAAMLLMIAMAGLVPFFLAGLSQSTSVRYRSTANNIARERMEEIRQLDYREILSETWLASRFGVAETVRGVGYDVTYGVVESSYGTGMLKEVTVTVGWTAPPKVSPVSLTTMIHQQYVGPRISRMEIKDPLPQSDPLGTPFDMLTNGQSYTVYCHVAESDWGLVIDNLNQPGMTVRDTYMKLARVDDMGVATVFTGPDGSDEITGMVIDVNEDTELVSDVYIPYTFDSGDIEDGYWEFRAVLFNQYDEPGNIWRLRLRVEDGGPLAPALFGAEPQFGDASILVYWSGSGEKDLDRYCLQRRGKAGMDWKSWEDVDMDIDPKTASLLDEGDIATSTDPWGSLLVTNDYQYRIWAVDIEGNSGYDTGQIAYVSVALPPAIPVTTTTVAPELTTTTVVGPTTTTVAALYTITIVNQRADSDYLVLVEPQNPAQPDVAATVVKKATITISSLPAGSYNLTATPSKSGLPVLVTSFTLGPGYNPDIPVLTITK